MACLTIILLIVSFCTNWYLANSKVSYFNRRFVVGSTVIGQSNSESDEERLFVKRYGNKKFLNILSKESDNGSRELTYYGQMVAGATARGVSATIIHPLNVIKTMLQCRNAKMPELKWNVLWRGSGAQLIMSIPHGAFNFAVTETTKSKVIGYIRRHPVSKRVPQRILDPLLDFFASAFATFICSAISTPQMVITDRIMSGMYSNLFTAVYGIASSDGVKGFYVGWLPAIAQKIPSYALTWMLFQQFKQAFRRLMDRAGTTPENTILGALASSVACSIMIPLDTIKTRIVTQRPGTVKVYDGIFDCFDKILKTEGPVGFYRALPPRLLAVVPMTGLQYGVYELMKRLIIGQPPPKLVKAQEALRKLRLQQQQQQQQQTK